MFETLPQEYFVQYMPLTVTDALTPTRDDLPLVVDASRYQGGIDYAKMKKNNVLAAAIRATVGNYYVDPLLKANWDGFNSQGIFTTVYHVVTPEISGAAQLAWFYAKLNENGIRPYMPVVMDCELSRGQTQRVITASIQYCCLGAGDKYGKLPFIYTRQTFWDYYVLPWSRWHEFPLWAARYAPYLDSPWSDGACEFRDWEEWTLWQFTSTADGPTYGAESNNLDLDWYNGTPQQLAELSGVQPVPVPNNLETPIGSARIKVPALNIRKEPIIKVGVQTLAGTINYTGGDLYVFERRDIDGNIWLRIGPQDRPLWVAMQYQGQSLLDWVTQPV